MSIKFQFLFVRKSVLLLSPLTHHNCGQSATITWKISFLTIKTSKVSAVSATCAKISHSNRMNEKSNLPHAVFETTNTYEGIKHFKSKFLAAKYLSEIYLKLKHPNAYPNPYPRKLNKNS